MAKLTETQSGILRRDPDHGWVLVWNGSGDGIRVDDLFRQHEGRAMVVTVEVFPNKKDLEKGSRKRD